MLYTGAFLFDFPNDSDFSYIHEGEQALVDPHDNQTFFVYIQHIVFLFPFLVPLFPVSFDLESLDMFLVDHLEAKGVYMGQ